VAHTGAGVPASPRSHRGLSPSGYDFAGGERVSYNAYGKQTITGPSGGVRAKSAVGFDRSFTGYVADNETGLLHARYRMYSPSLGRFTARDMLGYINGKGLYSGYFIPNSLDPSGLSMCSLVAGVIRSFLNTSQERTAWDNYVSGSGRNIRIPTEEMENIIGSNAAIVAHIDFRTKNCKGTCKIENNCVGFWGPEWNTFSGTAPNPHTLSIGGYALEIEDKCECCCLTKGSGMFASIDCGYTYRWSAKLNDLYDFDPRWFATERAVSAEVKTAAVWAAQNALGCGWKTFYHKGSTSSHVGTCDD